MWFVAIEPRSVSSTRFGDRVGARLPPPAFAVKKTIRNHDLSRAFVAIQAAGGCHAWNRGSVVAVPFATVRLGTQPPGSHLAMRMASVISSPHLSVRPPANGVVRMPLRTCLGELRIGHLPVLFRPQFERDRLAFQPTRRPVSRRLMYVSVRNDVVPHAKRFASRREASRRPRVVAGLLDWRAAFAIERRSVRSESSCDSCARSCDRPATSRSISRSLAQGFSSLDFPEQCPGSDSPPSRSNPPVATGDALMERPCLSGVSYRTVPRCDSLRGSSTFTTIRFV